MKRFSIRRRLLLLLLGSLVLVWAQCSGSAMTRRTRKSTNWRTPACAKGARTLLLLDLKRLGRLAEAEQADQRHGKHDDDDDSGAPLAFQVWSDDGELLLSSGAPAAPYRAREGYASRTIDGLAWRSYSARDRQRGYQVTVLEPLRARQHLIVELAKGMGQVLLLALPLLALLIWIGIGQGLRPLARLSEAIAARDAQNLEPIRLQQVPVEAQALVAALNRLLERLARSLDKERAFTADAAHELRTPLAAIKVQAEVALAAQDEASRRHAIGQVIAGVNRTTHLAQQLLLLARLEHVEPGARQAVDLGRLAADCTAQRADERGAKGH